MTRPLHAPRIFSPLGLALATLLAGGLAAVDTAPAAAQAPVALVQAGDAQMSCEALTTEINQLASGRTKAASKAANGRKLFGFASSALQLAAPVMTGGLLGGSGFGGGGLMTSLLSQTASSALQQGVMQAAVQSSPVMGGPASAADTSVEAQRIQRLSVLLQNKGC